MSFSTLSSSSPPPPNQIFHRHASKSAAPAARVSVENDHWQFLTIVFLRRAPKRVWGKAVFFWQRALLMVPSRKRQLLQAGTWDPKKNAIVGTASELGIESTLKLSAQDRQQCHYLERKHIAKVIHFLLWLYIFPFPWACHHLQISKMYFQVCTVWSVWPCTLMRAVKVSKAWDFQSLTEHCYVALNAGSRPGSCSLRSSAKCRRQGGN